MDPHYHGVALRRRPHAEARNEAKGEMGRKRREPGPSRTVGAQELVARRVVRRGGLEPTTR